MFKKLLMAATVAGAMVASSANASTVTITGSMGTAGGVNDFAGEMSAAFSNLTFLSLASFSVSDNTALSFTGVAAESGISNSLTVDGAGTLTETSDFGSGTDLLTSWGIGSIGRSFSAGVLDSFFRFSNFGLVAAPGSLELGVYVDGPLTDLGGGMFSVATSVFFLAFDDNGAGPDDNHDDLLVRVNVVPLPAAAWMLLAGLASFGAIGYRRRQRA